jgi:hypothetical protein
MKAFAEVLWPWPLIAIVRVGDNAEAYGDRFYFSAVVAEKLKFPPWPFRKGPRVGIIKALVATPPRCAECSWHERFRMTVANTAIDMMRERWGIEAQWERYK